MQKMSNRIIVLAQEHLERKREKRFEKVLEYEQISLAKTKWRQTKQGYDEYLGISKIRCFCFRFVILHGKHLYIIYIGVFIFTVIRIKRNHSSLGQSYQLFWTSFSFLFLRCLIASAYLGWLTSCTSLISLSPWLLILGFWLDIHDGWNLKPNA